MKGVQRFLINKDNHLRTAAILSAPVRPITDAVQKKPVSRFGTLRAAVAGTFTGEEQAEIQLEVLDTTATVPLETEPAFVGVGNGVMSAVDTTALTPRTITAELTDLGEEETRAAASLQGVQIVVAAAGADGNKFSLVVERDALVFTPQNITLLTALQEGTKSVVGPEYDWSTVIVEGDGQVPSDAKRVAFGENENNIYTQYKQFVDGAWTYFFEPALKQHVGVMTPISFVTGEYTVKLYEDVAGVPTLRETYPNIITLYDLLNAIKTTSTYLMVEGNVLYDRAPGGQALQELLLRTDAYYLQNTGFVEVEILPTTPTELIQATCFAATPEEDERAGFGQELWSVRGSVSGLITPLVRTNELIQGPYFQGKIKPNLPIGLNEAANGRFGVESFGMVTRTGEELTPQLCPASLTLGINARETTLTLTYTARPTEGVDCPCDSLNTPDLSGAECLGGNILPTEQGGAIVVYEDPDTLSRLKDLYDYYADVVRANTSYSVSGGRSYAHEDPFISQPADVLEAYTTGPLVTLQTLVETFEKVLALIDPLEANAVKTAGYAAWDTAFAEFQVDIDDYISSGVAPDEVLPAYENLADGDAVTVFEVTSGVYKVRKAVQGGIRYGFVDTAVLAGADATVRYTGLNDSVSSTETLTGSSLLWYPSLANPGKWVKVGPDEVGTAGVIFAGSLTWISATQGQAGIGGAANPIAYQLLANRYYSRLRWVLTEAELSPLGKFSANSLAAGDDCWRDLGTAFYWTVIGSNGAYAPAFTNEIYYSARKGEDNVYRGTKEFGFQINVACPENLKVGDKITLVISNIPEREGWKRGDKVLLGILGKSPFAFIGGKDGDFTQVWYVTDSLDGPLAPYSLDTQAPAPYSDSGVEFLITPGSLPFSKGDKFTFAVEGGHFRWRSVVGGVAGAWSASTAINVTPIALEDGLSVTFTLGPAQAIYTGDVFKFTALQPYAVSNLTRPNFQQWGWGAVNPTTAIFDLGAIKAVEAIALAFHDLPDNAVVTVSGSDDNITYDWAEVIAWKANAMGKLVSRAARYIKVVVAGAPSSAVGWVYVGPAIFFTYSAEVTLNRQYRMDHATGDLASVYRGRGVGSSVQWREGSLVGDDYDKMTNLLDWLKENDDETLLFFLQQSRDELVLGKVDSDNIEFNDVYNFQPNVNVPRRLSCTLPLKAVIF